MEKISENSCHRVFGVGWVLGCPGSRCLVVLTELTADGELAPGVHPETNMAGWPLSGAGGTRRHKRKTAPRFVRGSFVTSKLAPRDIDVLPIMDEDFETGPGSRFSASRLRLRTRQTVVRIRCVLVASVHWGRNAESLNGPRGLDTYQISRSFRKRGIVEVIPP
jgi:hypothetical protein